MILKPRALCPIVDHARVTVMTFSSPPSLPLSRPWAGVSAWQLVRPPPPEDGGLIGQALIGLKPMNAWVHTYTKPQTSSTRSRGLGRRIHESVEDTKLSTNKQHTLSRGPGWRIPGGVEDTKLSTNKQHTLSLSPWRCRSISENEMGVKAQRARVSE